MPKKGKRNYNIPKWQCTMSMHKPDNRLTLETDDCWTSKKGGGWWIIFAELMVSRPKRRAGRYGKKSYHNIFFHISRIPSNKSNNEKTTFLHMRLCTMFFLNKRIFLCRNRFYLYNHLVLMRFTNNILYKPLQWKCVYNVFQFIVIMIFSISLFLCLPHSDVPAAVTTEFSWCLDL